MEEHTSAIAVSTAFIKDTEKNYWQEDWKEYLMKYVAGVIIITGILGNFLTIAVMVTNAFRKSPSSLVLSTLALADTGVLGTGLMRWWLFEVMDDGYTIRDASPAACKIHTFFTYFFGHLSPACLVILTTERLISVYFPLQCRSICSKRRLAICVLFILIFLCFVDLNLLFTNGLYFDYMGRLICLPAPKYRSFHLDVWHWIDSSIIAFIPFVLILTGNILISIKLMQAQKNRDKMASSSLKDKQSLTPMLMAVSWCFLVLNLPTCIYFIGYGRRLWPVTTVQDVMNTGFAYTVVNLLAYLNNTINFFLYCLTGTKFRVVLMDMFRNICMTNKSKKMSVMTTMTDLKRESSNDNPM